MTEKSKIKNSVSVKDKTRALLSAKRKRRKIHGKINPSPIPGEDFSYKSFYEFSPLMYFSVDCSGKIVAVNSIGARHLGYTEEELLGESVLKVFYPEDGDAVERQLKECIADPDKLHAWEIRKVKKDGSVIWVKENARADLSNSRKARIQIACEDITEQKNAEFLVNTENKILEKIAENAPLEKTLNLLCREIESRACGMLCSFLILDQDKKTLRHGAAPSLPDEFIRAIDGVEIGPCVGSCGTAAYLKKPVIVSDIETDPLWADYKELALRHELRACWSTPIISTDEKVLGTFAMYYNQPRSPAPHETKVIESATHLARIAIERMNAQEMAARFGEILEESPNEIYIFDAETHKFVQVNKGARNNLGYTMDELREMTPLGINPEPASDFFRTLEPLVSGGIQKMRFVGVHKRKDGTLYPVEAFLHLSSLKGKRVFVLNATDVTELKKTEEELKENVEQLSKKNRYESIIRAVTESVHQSLDLQEVFDNAVDALNKNVEGATHVVIFMVEGNEAVMKANRGHAEWYLERVKRIPYPKGATWKTILEGKPLYVPDAEKDDALGPAGKEFGTKSYLSMPIRSEEKTVGCIHIHSTEKNRFSKEDLDMLQIVARQLESAVKNAKQAEALRQSEANLKQKLDELSKKKRYEEILNTITRSVHSSLDIQEVLQNAADAMNKDFDGADNVTIYFVEENEAVMKAHRGYPDWFTNKLSRIPYPKGFTWKTINEGKLLYCPDIENDTVIGQAGRDAGTKSYASMPIKYEGKTIGCININSLKKNAFDKDELDLLEIIAAQIEIAVNNARQAEALKESEERYRTLFAQTPVGVYTYDKNLVITNVNERHAEIMHSSREKIIGFDINDLEDKSFNYIHEQAIRGQKSRHEGYYKSTTGDAELYILVSASPLRDAQGNIVGGMSVVEDITDLKNAQDMLKESANRYRTLVENINDLIVETSADGRFIYLSPKHEEALGYKPEELAGRNIFENVHPDDIQHAMKEFSRVINTQTAGKAVFRYRHKNGNWRWFESTGQTVETASGELTCVIVSRDITDRRRFEEELFKAEKLESLGVLAGGIAHDFNNLLTVILGNISVSKMRLDAKDKIFRRLVEAENASFRARDLTSQLLTFSKGGAPVKEFVQSLGELIVDTANFVVSGSKVKCEFAIDDDLWPAEVDEGQISQVIHNLIINSDQAMPDGGIVNVSARNVEFGADNEFRLREGRYLNITIEDSGIGMTEELMEKIFDPYFTTKQRGSGLGLATVYSIVKNHDGHIKVSSNIGAGTRFDIYLPAVTVKPIADAGAENVRKGSGKILVMDDEQMVREIAGEMISQLGYEVEYASDGREAVEKYSKAMEEGEPFDAVMVDLTVPGGMGGKEAQKRLMEIDPAVKAIVSSGYSNDPVMSKYDEYGFKGVVTKPYNIELLSKAIHSVLNDTDKIKNH